MTAPAPGDGGGIGIGDGVGTGDGTGDGTGIGIGIGIGIGDGIGTGTGTGTGMGSSTSPLAPARRATNDVRSGGGMHLGVTGALRAILVVVAAAAAGACLPRDGRDAGPRPDARVIDAAARADAAGADGGGPASGFGFGIEYADPGLAAPYGAAGVLAAKTRLEAFSWGRTEPLPPFGGRHSYDWSCTDRVVSEYQAAGLVELQSYLTPSSLWASENLLAKDIMPRAERLADYEAWVGALMERYDGDGQDDMPGLRRAVLDWVVAGEWSGFWGSGDADDYLQLLTITRRAARAADPRIRIGLIPFLLTDVFEGNPPSAAQIAERLQDPPPWFRNSTAGMMKLLDRGDLYDHVDLHSLGDYTELPALLAWTRGELARRGLERPVWIDDAFPMSLLASGAPASLPHYPVTAEQSPLVYDLILRVADLAHPGHAAAAAWLEAQVALGVSHKILVAAGEGAAGIQIGNTQDWAMDTQVEGLGGRRQSAYLIGAAAFMGLVDASHPDGYEACSAAVPGASRPALRDLELLAAKLAGLRGAARLDLGAGVWAYRFTLAAGEVIAVWHEDDRLQLPGEAEVPVPVAVPVGQASRARVTSCVTDASAPRVDELAADAGAVRLSVTSVPLLVEPL